MRRKVLIRNVALGLGLAILASSCAGTGSTTPTGLPNFSKVDGKVYRSASPRSGGFEEANRLGVGTVLDLRIKNRSKRAAAAGLQRVHLPMVPWRIDDREVTSALRVLSDDKNERVLVHCHHGADRTGLVIAAYRIVVAGWSREQAITEMESHGFHRVWSDIPRYLRKFDINAMRSQLDLPEVDQPSGGFAARGVRNRRRS